MAPDQQGHRDGSPEAVAAREGAPWYRRRLARQCEERAEEMLRLGRADLAADLRIAAARHRAAGEAT